MSKRSWWRGTWWVFAVVCMTLGGPGCHARTAPGQRPGPCAGPALPPAHSGGPLPGQREPVAAPAGPQTGANLSILSVQIVDANGVALLPVAGKNFWVRVDYRYRDPVASPFTIRRAVNGWSHSARVDLGGGQRGETYWWHNWGVWLMHHGGTYSLTVTLDADDDIVETDESDNALTITFDVMGDVTAEWALVQAESGRALLGDGTDVIVGTMDDAFDFLHPWFDGEDSRGRPRLVAAAQNALGIDGSPLNTDHATALMGIVLAKGLNSGDLTGLAPDARYVTAEFINRAGMSDLPVPHVLDAAGFLVAHGAEVINMSWSWWFGSETQCYTGETVVTNLMADYLAYGRNIVCVAGVNQLPEHAHPTAPGSSRNIITVGGLQDDLLHVWEQQNHGPTLDGRAKPDVLGNDAERAVATHAGWRRGMPAAEGYVGTSFAAPFVTGAAAQLLDYGKRNGQSTDHRVIKAIIMNSAGKARAADGAAWSHSATQPLDDQQGTGVISLVRMYEMYSAGAQRPVEAAVPGYAFGEVSGVANQSDPRGCVCYRLGRLETGGATLSATLVWDRHTFWHDANGNGLIDAADSFYTSPTDCQDNLDLVLYRDGVVLAASRSLVDTVEHIYVPAAPAGRYELCVERLAVAGSGPGEEYALAWHADGEWTALPSGDLNDDGSLDASDADAFAQRLLNTAP